MHLETTLRSFLFLSFHFRDEWLGRNGVRQIRVPHSRFLRVGLFVRETFSDSSRYLLELLSESRELLL
jgi:hypothetical protein